MKTSLSILLGLVTYAIAVYINDCIALLVPKMALLCVFGPIVEEFVKRIGKRYANKWQVALVFALIETVSEPKYLARIGLRLITTLPMHISSTYSRLIVGNLTHITFNTLMNIGIPVWVAIVFSTGIALVELYVGMKRV